MASGEVVYPKGSYGRRIEGIIAQVDSDIAAMERLNKMESVRCRNLSLAITEAENSRYRLKSVLVDLPNSVLCDDERYYP